MLGKLKATEAQIPQSVNKIRNFSPGFFLGVRPKTQGRKNSNSRKISQKLKDFWPLNSRNQKLLGKFTSKTQNLVKN